MPESFNVLVKKSAPGIDIDLSVIYVKGVGENTHENPV